MKDSHSQIVTDTNILIDFHCGELLEALFCLPLTFLAPDVIVAELEMPAQELLLSWGLQSTSLTGSQVSRVMELAADHCKPSINDLFALVLAQTKSAPLLTGDMELRKLAEAETVEVHGSLWLLDGLVELEVTTPLQAAKGLDLMLTNGSTFGSLKIRRV